MKTRNSRGNRKLPKKDDLINKDIRFARIMVIGPNGPLGEMSSYQGQDKALEMGLDLVCVSPKLQTPICKIMDYGKFKFEKSKKTKESKKNRTIIVLKEVRLTPNIGQHDLEVKAKHARKFLEDKSKVKVSLKFRGRERAHLEIGEDVLRKFFAIVEDVAIMEKAPFQNGRFFDMVIAPNVKKQKERSSENA